MNKILLSLLIAGLLISSCSAEVLMTPAAAGKDNMLIQGFYSSTPIKVADANMTAFGPKIIYGINDDWDLIGKVGSVSTNVSGSNSSATEIGIGGKYTIPKSMWDTPVDMAAVLGYDSISGKDVSQGTTYLGLIASRYLRSNFTVYGSLYGMMNNNKYSGAKSSNSNDFQWGFGGKYQISKKLSALAELMLWTMASDSYQTFSMAIQYEM